MIARVWRATATEEGKNGYIKHFTATILPDLMNVGGFLSADVLVRPKSEKHEIVVLTRWESEKDIRQFAGKDISIANVQSEATGFLEEFDSKVTHFEVEVVSEASI